MTTDSSKDNQNPKLKTVEASDLKEREAENELRNVFSRLKRKSTEQEVQRAQEVADLELEEESPPESVKSK